jgi:hypothetical protein
MVTDTNMKQWKRCMNTHKVYLELFNIYSISYSPNVILPLYVTMVTHQNWPWPVKFTLKALGGTVASKVVYLVFHISPQVEVTRDKVWVSKGEGTPRKLATATQPQFPRIIISRSWIHVTEWSSANWGNSNTVTSICAAPFSNMCST